MDSEKMSIREVAAHYQVTTRTIRYYEELGMLAPERQPNGQRIFGKKEHIRLTLILRGKKYGFKLDEIKEMIELFDRDRTGRKQLERTIAYGTEKVSEVTNRIEELTQIRSEMEALLNDFQTRLHVLAQEEETSEHI